ncbi:alanine:cation symporter family protein [Hoyosella rhizosphaerae]|uniref:Na+/alanine symporter n=1 Tax=Hoyosella rhizosphaerae TaxID=1755582 RepID=A0A916X7R2_9ACTN|nr:alanine/glycine:cation symporter family protein [Hoyosella rhizosphaerae]MBN4927270.1 alanine:cation symporter family protein [Hoyosella rhizosphaerae]GGC52590.1 Na+/alanine symporter [Hoyosella rhizosphaerae]
MDELIDRIASINDIYWYAVVAGLLLSGFYYTIRSRVLQISMIREMFRSVAEPALVMENGRKGLSAFQSFTIAAAARVGTGNIAGVAVAITIGGPGAVFWMWVTAVIGAATAFIESTLGQLYKVKDRDSYRGGPAYYITRGLRNRHLAIAFALVALVTYPLVFNTVQANTISDVVQTSTGNSTTLFTVGIGLLLAALTALVVFGGVRRIARVTEFLVPIMALSYVGLGLVVVALNITEVPGMFVLIFENAFGIQELVGGGIAAVIMNGVRRGLYSNEAGMGSIPNVSATAAVSHPVKQGLVQSLGVYFDTLVICSMTAFIILLADPTFGQGREGASLTQDALALQFGDWAVHYLAVVIFFLAFSSILGNYYIGEANVSFMTNSTLAVQAFRLTVVSCVFIGSVASLGLVWTMADFSMGIMVAINLAVIAPLSVIVFRLLDHYRAQRKQGLDPVFVRSDMPDLTNIECWGSETEAKGITQPKTPRLDA